MSAIDEMKDKRQEWHLLSCENPDCGHEHCRIYRLCADELAPLIEKAERERADRIMQIVDQYVTDAAPKDQTQDAIETAPTLPREQIGKSDAERCADTGHRYIQKTCMCYVRRHALDIPEALPQAAIEEAVRVVADTIEALIHVNNVGGKINLNGEARQLLDAILPILRSGK